MFFSNVFIILNVLFFKSGNVRRGSVADGATVCLNSI